MIWIDRSCLQQTWSVYIIKHYSKAKNIVYIEHITSIAASLQPLLSFRACGQRLGCWTELYVDVHVKLCICEWSARWLYASHWVVSHCIVLLHMVERILWTRLNSVAMVIQYILSHTPEEYILFIITKPESVAWGRGDYKYVIYPERGV